MSLTPRSDFNNSYSGLPGEPDPLPAGMARCGGCWAIGYAVDLYCACCGGPMPKRCRTCGGVVQQAIANYCTQCGAPMAGRDER